MKAIKFLQITAFLILTLTVVSCVNGDEYDVPPTATQVEPDVTVNSSIQAVKSAMDQHFASNNENKMTYDDDSSVVFEGYVVSSDLGGNYFESIVVQDSPSNPTHGIEILIDKSSLFETFEVGRKVYVKMAGLSVSYEDGDDNDPSDLSLPGRYIVGDDQGGFGLDEISQFSYLNSILRSTESATIVPTPVMISDLTQDHINTFIQLSDMQFNVSELGKTFAGEASDSFDGFRNLVSCADGSVAVLQTSTFADFKSYDIPEQRGYMNTVLMKDYRADFLVLVINTPTDLDFTDSSRCDPVFVESFDDGTDNTVLNTEGWLNYAEEGTELWAEDVYQGNGYARFSAYGTNESSNIGWLISPSMDLDSQEGEVLSFQTQHAYPDSGHDPLSVMISTDFDGTEAGILTATWIELSFDVSYIVDYGGWFTFTDSGQIDLSGYSGTGYIAFRYSGSDNSNQNMTLDIDNIQISTL